MPVVSVNVDEQTASQIQPFVVMEFQELEDIVHNKDIISHRILEENNNEFISQKNMNDWVDSWGTAKENILPKIDIFSNN